MISTNGGVILRTAMNIYLSGSGRLLDKLVDPGSGSLVRKKAWSNDLLISVSGEQPPPAILREKVLLTKDLIETTNCQC